MIQLVDNFDDIFLFYPYLELDGELVLVLWVDLVAFPEVIDFGFHDKPNFKLLHTIDLLY